MMIWLHDEIETGQDGTVARRTAQGHNALIPSTKGSLGGYSIVHYQAVTGSIAHFVLGGVTAAVIIEIVARAFTAVSCKNLMSDASGLRIGQ